MREIRSNIQFRKIEYDVNSGRTCISCTGQFIKAQSNKHCPIKLYCIFFLTNGWISIRSLEFLATGLGGNPGFNFKIILHLLHRNAHTHNGFQQWAAKACHESVIELLKSMYAMRSETQAQCTRSVTTLVHFLKTRVPPPTRSLIFSLFCLILLCIPPLSQHRSSRIWHRSLLEPHLMIGWDERG